VIDFVTVDLIISLKGWDILWDMICNDC